MTRRLLDDCFLHDTDRLRHDEAIALILARTTVVAHSETVPLAQCHGRVVAKTINANRNIPPFTNAAVDGYAFHSDALKQGDATLPVRSRIAAGSSPDQTIESNQAARIFTGAPMPHGVESCAMQEDCQRDGDNVTIPAGLKPGANVRHAGEDIKQGTTMFEPGHRLRPQDVAALASTGIAEVECYCRLKVALISTGDEIIRPGTNAAPGQVYDSNHFLLRALLDNIDAEIIDFGIIADDRTAVTTAISDAATSCNVILTTGGASRGEADFIVETISDLGVLHAWQLAIKPGRPLAMGQIGDTVFFGLPGNPVAAFITFLLYAKPMFAQLQGANWTPPQRYPLPADFAIANKKTDRREFWRGSIENTATGPMLRKFTQDGSGLITSLRQSQGLIEVAENIDHIAKGDLLNFIPFTAF